MHRKLKLSKHGEEEILSEDGIGDIKSGWDDNIQIVLKVVRNVEGGLDSYGSE
jgi:hypothetical protein